MGGYVAVQMLRYFKVQSLILFCPAIYNRQAYQVPFNAEFTKIIRQPKSWQDSDAWELLHNFDGQLLTIIGSDDAVIPPEVIQQIQESGGRARKKELVIVPHAPHKILPWLSQHPDVEAKICEKIFEFIKG